jgi:hypothetical protein
MDRFCQPRPQRRQTRQPRGAAAARSSGLATIEWRFTARLFHRRGAAPQGGSQPDQVGDLLGQAG